MAAVIDGQHRLNAFEYLSNKERFNLELVCSVYFDLPNSYQAFLFATINSNQKRVDRSLALEQFGFNVDDEPEKAWTPEKFAVFLSRKYNIDSLSPFHQRIKVTPLHSERLFADLRTLNWTVSTATIVDGIMSLISSNPKRDRIEMQQKSIITGRTREMLLKFLDYSPLRELFVQNKDQDIYNIIKDFFLEVNESLWLNANPKSYIIKTVGIQALFDILKYILISEGKAYNINFHEYISKASNIDFSNSFFQASGIGRNRIKNALGLSLKIIHREKIKRSDLIYYDSIIKNGAFNYEKWPWEEEAENAVINTLEKAEWNYRSRSVRLYLESDYTNPQTFDNFNTFHDKLIEIAELSFVNNLPSDSEFADEQREKFDVEELVGSRLSDYELNLRKLRWQ